MTRLLFGFAQQFAASGARLGSLSFDPLLSRPTKLVHWNQSNGRAPPRLAPLLALSSRHRLKASRVLERANRQQPE